MSQTPEWKIRHKAYDQMPERKAKMKIEKKASAVKLRLEVFSHYSKKLSKSDIACCICCLPASFFFALFVGFSLYAF